MVEPCEWCFGKTFEHDPGCVFYSPFERGAAAALGLIGMAEAIRDRIHGEACETCGGRCHGATSWKAGFDVGYEAACSYLNGDGA